MVFVVAVCGGGGAVYKQQQQQQFFVLPFYENYISTGHPKTIRACLSWSSYVVKWCDNRVSEKGRHTHTYTEKYNWWGK